MQYERAERQLLTSRMERQRGWDLIGARVVGTKVDISFLTKNALSLKTSQVSRTTISQIFHRFSMHELSTPIWRSHKFTHFCDRFLALFGQASTVWPNNWPLPLHRRRPSTSLGHSGAGLWRNGTVAARPYCRWGNDG